MNLLSFFGGEKLSPSPTSDFWYGGVGSQTTAGVTVNESTAFNYSVCWAATRLIAGTTGWLPFNLYKRLPSGGAEIDSTHRVHRLLHDQPNDDMGSTMFRAMAVNHQVNWGNTFSEIVRNRGGEVMSLEPIHPSRIPMQNIKRENGRLVYYVKSADNLGSVDRIERQNMFHVPSIISDNGIIGKGVITAARETIGKAMGTQQHGASSLANGGSPPLALKNGKFRTPEDMESYRQQLERAHKGPGNAGKWLILPNPDAEVQMLGFSLQDSQFIESQQFDIEEMARWYGVPPHLIGHLLRATFNNIEELGVSFVKYSLILWLKLWEQEVWRKLLTPAEKETHYAKFVVDALERGNLASRTEAGVKKFFNGLWSLNDWASQEDMNPITETTMVDGKLVNLGDVRFVQQAMIPLSQAAKGPPQAPANTPPPEPEEEPQPADEPTLAAMATADQLTTVQIGIDGKLSEFAARIETLSAEKEQLQSLVTTSQQQTAAALAVGKQLANAHLRDVWSRTLSVEINAVKRVAEKPEKFVSRLNEFYGKHTATLERNLLEPVTVCLSVSGDTRQASEVVKVLASTHAAESLKQIDALLSCQGSELPAKVEECVSKWHEERATVTI